MDGDAGIGSGERGDEDREEERISEDGEGDKESGP
jgi:hypothetical protein